MSKPPINPSQTTAGIAVDPQTLERVIPESKRPDGTLRKQIKIRPGFTPQEDVRRFRGTKQAQMDANTLPKGHIIGWAPPPQSTATSGSATKPLSKSAKKNAKRKEKKEEKKKQVPDNWEDEEEDGDDVISNVENTITNGNAQKEQGKTTSGAEQSNSTITISGSDSANVDALISSVEKLRVQ